MTEHLHNAKALIFKVRSIYEELICCLPNKLMPQRLGANKYSTTKTGQRPILMSKPLQTKRFRTFKAFKRDQVKSWWMKGIYVCLQSIRKP